MRKIAVLFVGLFLLSSIVFAAQGGTDEPGTGQGTESGDESQGQKGINDPGTGTESEPRQEGQGTGQGQQVQEEEETQNKGEDKQIIVQQRQELKAQTKTQLQEMIQQKQQAMNQELEGKKEKEQKVYQNQNQVRLAVHSLLAMEGLVGGIGKNVSQIARQFNNSVQATIRAEEKIQTRSAFARFFAGGDEKAAGEIEQEVNSNRERIKELKQLHEQSDCDEEVKAMMQEQIQNMEQEQNRLQELAQKEKKSKGLFGWLWK
ncbi:MAG: hypothetical protein KKA61_00295 [Nanoarchaeota archaeon]|nr:hypothetical protein [Nanoarchaeota archaeon]